MNYQRQFEYDINKNKHHFDFGMLLLPIEISNFYKKRSISRVIIYFDNLESWNAGILSKPGLGKFIMVNKTRRNKILKIIKPQFRIIIEKDNSKYGMPMPSEFREALKLYPEAEPLFEELTAGKKRSLLYIIGKYKHTQKRVEKSIVILEHLINQRGHIDYKKLQQEFK